LREDEPFTLRNLFSTISVSSNPSWRLAAAGSLIRFSHKTVSFRPCMRPLDPEGDLDQLHDPPQRHRSHRTGQNELFQPPGVDLAPRFDLPKISLGELEVLLKSLDLLLKPSPLGPHGSTLMAVEPFLQPLTDIVDRSATDAELTRQIVHGSGQAPTTL